MKAKISKGQGFRGLLNYLMDKGRGELIGGNMAATDKAGLSAEFGAVRCLRPDVAKPVWHCSLSLPIGDDLSAGQWQEVAAAFLGKMDVKDNQYCIVRHRDKEHQHIHIVLNRVGVDGGVWYADRDVYRAIEACKQLEAERDYLQDTQSRDNTNRRYYPSYREQSRSKKGQDITRKTIHDAIRRTIAAGSASKLTPREFVEALKQYGIEARPNISSTGRINGFSFCYEGARYTGSKVGAKWRQLMQQLDYSPSRDNAYLMGLIGRKPQDMAFSPAEFERLRTLLDAYMETPAERAIDIRDEIRRIGIAQLTRGVKALQDSHYQQLADLYDEQRRTWAKIRASRPPLRLTSRDMASVAMLFIVSPALGALVLLPFAIDRLLRHSRKARAHEISEEIAKMKQEIIKNGQRKDAIKELRQDYKQFTEEKQKMEKAERDIIKSHVERKINDTAARDKDFGSYVDFINQSGIIGVNPTYDELAAMYSRESWTRNNDIMRGTGAMIDAAASATEERPENRAVYILPLVFDALSRTSMDDTIGGKELERVISAFDKENIADMYIKMEKDAEEKKERELLEQSRENNEKLQELINIQHRALQGLPDLQPSRLTGKINITPELYNDMKRVYQDYEGKDALYIQSNIDRWRAEKEKETIKKQNRELQEYNKSYSERNRILSDRCEAAEEQCATLSEKLELITTYLHEKGIDIDANLAEWIAAREAIQRNVNELTQYDGMEL